MLYFPFSYLITMIQLFAILCIISYPIELSALPARLAIFRGAWEDPIVISGEDVESFTTEDVDISCICITGLWAFYEKDGRKPFIIGGEDEYCTQIYQKIVKITLLSAPSGESNANAISVFDKTMSHLNAKLVYKKFDSESMWETPADVQTVTIITVGDLPFTFTRTIDYCLMPNPTGDTAFYYCIFENEELSKSKNVAHITPYCDVNTKVLRPGNCVPYFKAGAGVCPELEEQSVRYPGKNDVKRSIDQMRLGRVFINGSVLMKNYSTAKKIDDLKPEDFDMLKHVHTKTSDLIKAELWNFVTQAVDKLSGFGKSSSTSAMPKYKSTAFRLLELCKQISQASCPSFYSGNNFFEVAIGTFISLQSKVFKFQDTFGDFATERRITLALSKCLQNFTDGGPYPFIEKKGDCNQTADLGTYEKYGAVAELDMRLNHTGLNWEPIIDTAWQSFIHAHSACYGYFSYYNDHHTFMSIMMPLFTNEVNDLWYRTPDPATPDLGALQTPESDIYGFAVGYLREGVEFSSTCSAFGRLESEYPWDITRPGRKAA